MTQPCATDGSGGSAMLKLDEGPFAATDSGH